ncbi:MAG: hypothetical protein Q4B70_05695 [Lachnospiraceae bacterium]|nr:hypothetical protein [Lachnospiraceae bacterium]
MSFYLKKNAIELIKKELNFENKVSLFWIRDEEKKVTETEKKDTDYENFMRAKIGEKKYLPGLPLSVKKNILKTENQRMDGWLTTTFFYTCNYLEYPLY